MKQQTEMQCLYMLQKNTASLLCLQTKAFIIKQEKEFWNNAVATMLNEFRKDNYAEGLAEVI